MPQNHTKTNNIKPSELHIYLESRLLAAETDDIAAKFSFPQSLICVITRFEPCMGIHGNGNAHYANEMCYIFFFAQVAEIESMADEQLEEHSGDYRSEPRREPEPESDPEPEPEPEAEPEDEPEDEPEPSDEEQEED